MTQAKIIINPVGQSSQPVIIHVDSIKFQSTQKSQSILYYRIPFTFTYSPIQKLKNKNIFLPNSKLSYKIINYVTKKQQFIQQSAIQQAPTLSQNQFYMKSATKSGIIIQLFGTLINQSAQSSIFADISLKKIDGYEKFNQYRKKYKTLQNITRKIDFLLDHRIRLVYEKGNSKYSTKKQQFVFSMDQLKDKEIKNWYVQLTDRGDDAKMTIYLQQITRVGDVSLEKIIQEASFSANELSPDCSYDIILQLSQYLRITFSLITVKNKNLTKYQFVSIRVLQTSLSNMGEKIRIGSQQSINSFSGGLELEPVLDKRYYDLQYGYLKSNLEMIKEMDRQLVSSRNESGNSKQKKGQGQLHRNLSKLTSSSKKYQHFINQTVLDMSSYKKLVFKIQQNCLSIPTTYLLEGYNVFHNENVEIEFLLEVPQKHQNVQVKVNQYQMLKTIPRKLIKLRISDLLNLSQVLNIMQNQFHSSLESKFYLKIKCQSTIYTIEFNITQVNEKQFKSQIKQLDLRTQYSQLLAQKQQQKFMLLTRKPNNKQTLIMIKSRNLQPFYLLQMTDTTPVTFNISTKKHIIMNGHINKSQFYRYQDTFMQNIILSSSGHGNVHHKAIIACQFSQILHNIQGPVFNFKFKYRITTENSSKIQATQYGLDFQIIRVKEDQGNDSKNKSSQHRNRLSQKVNLQIQNNNQHSDYQKSSSLSSVQLLKQFANSRSSFTQKTQNLTLCLKLRKMHYDYQLNLFDNDMLIEKKLSINRDTIKDKTTQGTIFAQIPPHYFREFKYQAYDSNIKQKINLHLEVYCSKEPFGMGDQHVYRFKVPNMFWRMNSLVKQQQNVNIESQPNVQVQTFISSKKQKSNKPQQLQYNSAQQLSLNHFNYNDGISIKLTKHSNNLKQQQIIGYNKIRQCIKAKCHVVNNQIGWLSDGEWYFGVLNMINSEFYFLIKMEFDANAERESSNNSRASNKTKSKERSERSNSNGGPDLLAKTLKNFDIIKLKQTKNKLQQESRQLTAKYVQRQQMIIYYNKKISQADEHIRRKKQQMDAAISIGGIRKPTQTKGKKQQNQKKISLLRSICQCGQRNPQFMGYCKKCLQRLRQSYETYLKQYQQKAAQYEMVMFQKYNIRDKVEKLKTKLRAYKKIINGDVLEGGQAEFQEQNGFGAAFNDIEQKRLSLEIQQLKLEIFQLQRQRQMQFQRRKYKREQLQKKIKKQDDQIWAKSQQVNKLSVQLIQIKQQISKDQQKKQKY